MSENKKPVRTEQESSKLSQLDMLLGLVCAIFFVILLLRLLQWELLQ